MLCSITGDVTDEADNCDATLDATFSDERMELKETNHNQNMEPSDCGNTTTNKPYG